MLEAIHRWDVSTFERIVTSRLHQFLVGFALILTRTADGWPYFLVPGVLYLLGADQVVEFFVIAAQAYTIERLIYVATKNGIKRKRPAEVVPNFNSLVKVPDEFSFPSGHTSAAFLMATLLVLFYASAFPAVYLLFLWAASIGFSRLVLGVHFPTDVLMGAALGISIGVLSFEINIGHLLVLLH